jgi:peroxiredoxin Q/BCP
LNIIAEFLFAELDVLNHTFVYKLFTMRIIVLFTTVLCLSASALTAQEGLSVGDKAPLFSAIADDGAKWDVSKYLGKNQIVVYFYPAAMTGGCTKQACSYRDHMDDLQAAGVIVVGVSGDTPEGLKLFKKAENLNFPLLSDEKGDIANAFGVPVSAGGSIKRIVDGTEHELLRGLTAKRWTFIIGKDKKIIYRNDAVNAEKDTEEVLNFLKLQAVK